MNLFINSPAYFTQKHGVIDDIYNLCQEISANIDVKKYTDSIDTIGITPIIVPADLVSQGFWKEEKKISLPYRMASISIHSDYDMFCKADVEGKKKIILENIFQSLKIVKGRLKDQFNYNQMECDMVHYISQMYGNREIK